MSSYQQTYATLNNGNKMPLLGLGTYNLLGKSAEEAVSIALDTGYRLIDTAYMYGNEKEIGNAVRSSRLQRSEIFVTTKVNNTDQGYDQALRAFDKSSELLNIDYIDLYLVHWPIKGKRKDTWLALEKLYEEKRVKAIGIANYLLPFLQELKTYSSVIPVVNQVEFSPYLYLKKELEYCQQNSIQLQAYTPLLKAKKNNDIKLVELANKYNKTASQVILRWNMQRGVSAIPKSGNKERIQENFDIFDFQISEKDMLRMDSFHEGLRIVDDPMIML
jgi:methylglyoxal/glyoxal reductase